MRRVAFRLSWDWLQNGLGPLWKPFLLGCLICGVVAGVLGWMALELAWRWRVEACTRKSPPRRAAYQTGGLTRGRALRSVIYRALVPFSTGLREVFTKLGG